MRTTTIALKTEQSNKNQAASLDLSTNRTFGEKVHHAIFDVGINFILNLTLSAAFTHWVSHSQKSFTLFSKEFEAPSKIQRKVAKAIHDIPGLLRPFGKREAYEIDKIPLNNTRVSVATTMSQILTLTAIGHPIMIPSVWLGAKVKAPMVAWLNRRHYGDEAMQSDDMQKRQAMIDAAERPTLLGATVGRLGTILATQTVGYTIGNASNIIGFTGRKLGIPVIKEFKGLDAVTEWMGEKGGGIVRNMLPKKAEALDIALRDKHEFSFSTNQKQMMPALANKPYGTLLTNENGKTIGGGGGFEHFGRYLISDILYTLVTASTIMPVINFMKHHARGLTYHPTVSADTQAVLDKHQLNARSYQFSERIPEQALANPADDSRPKANENTIPNTRINRIETQQRIAHAQEPQVTT